MTEPTPLTVPASCLAQLGGLQRGPAVLSYYVDPDHPGEMFDLRWDGAGDQMPDPSCRRLLVEESEPALLRVLARHLGWDGEGRLVMWHALTSHYVIQQYDRGGIGTVSHLPLVAADLDYLEALAAAVVYAARVARLAAWEAATPEKEVSAVYEQLAAVGGTLSSKAQRLVWAETLNDWPAWTVTT